MNPDHPLYRAARVAKLMAPECPKLSPSGKWKLNTFTITEEVSQLEELRAAIRASKHAGHGADRWVPPGEYVALYRQKTEDETARFGGPPLASEWQPVMSDTPNEIEDHAAPLDHATGRVLVHGLGLGCIVHALLQKFDVKRIDVVEIDREVMDLTGRYVKDPRVFLHHGDALTFPWGERAHWDYVWHDIWTTISPDNLTDEAEHGVSYQALLDRFAPHCDRQEAWAFEDAKRMQAREAEEVEIAKRFVAEFNTADRETRINMILERQFGHHLFENDGPPPEDVLRLFAMSDAGRQFLARIERAADHPIKEFEALMLLGFVD